MAKIVTAVLLTAACVLAAYHSGVASVPPAKTTPEIQTISKSVPPPPGVGGGSGQGW